MPVETNPFRSVFLVQLNYCTCGVWL